MRFRENSPAATAAGEAGDDPSKGPPGSGALTSLCAIARLHHVAANPDTLAHQMGLSVGEAVSVSDVLLAAQHLGLKAIIQRNMAHICKGRTVLIIAHRLSAVRHAHRIIVMDKGQIVEAGPHDALIQQPRGLYAHLWRMQDGGHPTEGPTA